MYFNSSLIIKPPIYRMRFDGQTLFIGEEGKDPIALNTYPVSNEDKRLLTRVVSYILNFNPIEFHSLAMAMANAWREDFDNRPSLCHLITAVYGEALDFFLVLTHSECPTNHALHAFSSINDGSLPPMEAPNYELGTWITSSSSNSYAGFGWELISIGGGLFKVVKHLENEKVVYLPSPDTEKGEELLTDEVLTEALQCCLEVQREAFFTVFNMAHGKLVLFMADLFVRYEHTIREAIKFCPWF